MPQIPTFFEAIVNFYSLLRPNHLFDFPTSTLDNPIPMRTLMAADILITDISRGGKGVARLESGQVVFVPLTAIGDRVRVEYRETSKNYLDAESVEILVPSPQRVAPACPAFGKCGGCEWQHIPYETQWEIKKKGLLHSLQRSQANPQQLPLEELPAENPWHYRNRIQLRGEGEKLEFYARGSKNIIPIEKCWIAREEINSLLPEIRNEGKKLPRPYKVEIALNAKGKTDVFWNARHSAGGFRQVFDEQNNKLREWIFEILDGNEIILDLFGGSGNLSELLRARAEKIICVDSFLPEPDATKKYFEKMQWIAKPVHQWISEKSIQANAAILDPPREGLDVNYLPILEGLENAGVKQAVLVGCDVDAWTRDVCRFQRRGWTLQRIAALDLFPHTHHLESLAYFTKSP